MNKIIKEQLSKIEVADMSNYTDNNYSFIIPKSNIDRFEEDKCYLIELNDVLIKDNKDSLLQINWNNNTYPENKYLKIDVSKVLGKMIKVNSIAYDYENHKDLTAVWSGWLPIELIKIIEVV